MSVAISVLQPGSEYDAFAWIYNRYMAGDFTRRALPAIERLLLRRLGSGDPILDLCCGTGQMARALSDRGYSVTGLDSSPRMLLFARENAPLCDFLLGDARQFSLAAMYAGVLSTFNSLAHLSSTEELQRVFRNVYATLCPGGTFVFDLSMEEAYYSNWRGAFSM